MDQKWPIGANHALRCAERGVGMEESARAPQTRLPAGGPSDTACLVVQRRWQSGPSREEMDASRIPQQAEAAQALLSGAGRFSRRSAQPGGTRGDERLGI